ncbi:MAG: SDR family NAD(P)-dependent oxidoreductase [Kiritimatiellae bacterium]|nr:SDR family NAD(P)-dependent oxidoreductase [Kiritimatiellia bacterium]
MNGRVQADAPLADKVALVTGGSKRLGRRICLALAGAGCDVVVHCNRSRADAEALAGEIRGLGRQAWCVEGDFSNPYAADATMDGAWEMAGWVDVLVNNASEWSHAELADATVEETERLWRVNCLSPVRLARAMREKAEAAVASGMLPDHWRGSVVNVLDRDIARRSAGRYPYWSSKRALADFTECAALEFAPRIAMNGVAPGPVLAPESPALSEPAGELPLGLRPAPADVAAAVVYLASAPSVTGQILYVDSGQRLLG